MHGFNIARYVALQLLQKSYVTHFDGPNPFSYVKPLPHLLPGTQLLNACV